MGMPGPNPGGGGLERYSTGVPTAPAAAAPLAIPSTSPAGESAGAAGATPYSSGYPRESEHGTVQR